MITVKKIAFHWYGSMSFMAAPLPLQPYYPNTYISIHIRIRMPIPQGFINNHIALFPPYTKLK